MTTDKKVIIIGGGLAGLSLANSLQSQNVPFEVYERDEAFDSRAQGWGISIHFALQALKKCMPKEAFENLGEKISVNPESDSGMSFSFLSNTGQVFMSNASEPGTSYRANRHRLRSWLLEPVQDHVHWNKRFDYYKENTEENSVTAYFKDGTQVTGDILVGTDGVQSPVACQLVGGKEKFDELTTSIDVRCFGVLTWTSEELWGEMSKESPVHISVINGQQDKDDDIKQKTFNMFTSLHSIDRTKTDKPIQVFWSMSRFDAEGVIPKFDDPNNTECLALLKTWAINGFPENSPFRKLILDTPSDIFVMPINIRERMPTAELLQALNRRVVLVGDAAHPMTMFKGEGNTHIYHYNFLFILFSNHLNILSLGGNHAIVDAVNLGIQLGDYNQEEKTLDEALESYYSEMIPRGQKAVKESHDSAVMVHCNPEIMLKVFKDFEKHTVKK